MFINKLFKQMVLLTGLFLTVQSHAEQIDRSFAPTIPVVDMREYYNEATREKFYQDVSNALHEVGFFGVINPSMDVDALKNGYTAVQQFFWSPIELKDEIWKPELSGQRGYVHSETAQGFSRIDHKEFLHIGHHQNIWPTWMDLQTPTEALIAGLDVFGEVISKAISRAVGQEEDFFGKQIKEGESLLRPIHYPADPEPGQYWAAAHTDIDLFTILPMATEEGLQLLHNGEWIDVRVPPNAFIVNAGDKLMNMTNGYFRSGKHRVVSKPNCERFSIVYFIHPRDADDVSPLPACIAMTGGEAQFPQATSFELLAVRLRELRIASPGLLELLDSCGINQRIESLVLSGKAHPSVQRTYQIWLDSKGP